MGQGFFQHLVLKLLGLVYVYTSKYSPSVKFLYLAGTSL